MHADKMAGKNAGAIVQTLRGAQLQAYFMLIIWIAKFRA